MCTGVYVGKKVSANGHTIIARSADTWQQRDNMTSFYSFPRKENNTNSYIDTVETDFKYKLPKTTYKYNSLPVIPAARGVMGDASANEYGLAVTATVTASTCDAILALDPFTKTGICEPVVNNLLGCTCKTARECVDLIEKIMEDQGSNAAETILVADQDEAWLIELYSGHQWAAMKLPEDKMSVYANCFKIQTEYENLSDDEFRHSKDLFTLPETNNLGIYKDGKLTLAETYEGKGEISEYDTVREYFGWKFFCPSVTDEYKVKKYDMCFTPDKKVGLKDIFDLYRHRYEGSKFCPEENEGIEKTRLIATEVTYCIQALEVIDSLPAEMSIVMWVCVSNAEHSLFLPYLNLGTDYYKDFKYQKRYDTLTKESPKNSEDKPIKYDESIAALNFKRLCAIAQDNRKLYSQGIRKHWSKVEEEHIAKYPKLIEDTYELYKEDKTAAIDYINKYTIDMQKNVLAEAKSMFDELVWYISSHIETLKYVRDAETHKLRRNDPVPFEPTLCYKEKYLN